MTTEREKNLIRLNSGNVRRLMNGGGMVLINMKNRNKLI